MALEPFKHLQLLRVKHRTLNGKFNEILQYLNLTNLKVLVKYVTFIIILYIDWFYCP